MSIYKPFIIDSQNKSRGDDNNFEIDIDKNYFNKPPNTIKLIDTVLDIETVLINETNNMIRIEELDSSGNIIQYQDITFQPLEYVENMFSFVTYINNSINNSFINVNNGIINGENILILAYYDMEPETGFVTSDILNIYTNKVEKYIYGYFAIYINSSVYSMLNIAINFNIPNSIGNLLGFGEKRLVPTRDLYTGVPNFDNTYYVIPACYYTTSKYMYKSSNKIIDFTNINNVSINPNYATMVVTDTNSTNLTYEINNGAVSGNNNLEFITNFANNLTAAINLTTFQTDYKNRYNTTFDCSFVGEWVNETYYFKIFTKQKAKIADTKNLNVDVYLPSNSIYRNIFPEILFYSKNLDGKFYNTNDHKLKFSNQINEPIVLTQTNTRFHIKGSNTSDANWQQHSLNYSGNEVKADFSEQLWKELNFTSNPNNSRPNAIGAVRAILYDNNTGLWNGYSVMDFTSVPDVITSTVANVSFDIDGISIVKNDYVLINIVGYTSTFNSVYNGVYIMEYDENSIETSNKWQLKRIPNYRSSNFEAYKSGDYVRVIEGFSYSNTFWYFETFRSGVTPSNLAYSDDLVWFNGTSQVTNYNAKYCHYLSSDDGPSSQASPPSLNYKIIMIINGYSSYGSHNGAGPGKTITINNGGTPLTVNGVTLNVSDTILINNVETINSVFYNSHNGLYNVSQNDTNSCILIRNSMSDSDSVYNNTFELSDTLYNDRMIIRTSTPPANTLWIWRVYYLYNSNVGGYDRFRRLFDYTTLYVEMTNVVNNNYDTTSFPPILYPNLYPRKSFIQFGEGNKGRYGIRSVCGDPIFNDPNNPFIFGLEFTNLTNINNTSNVFHYLGYLQTYKDKTFYYSSNLVDSFNVSTNIGIDGLNLPNLSINISIPKKSSLIVLNDNKYSTTTGTTGGHTYSLVEKINKELTYFNNMFSNSVKINYDYSSKCYNIFSSLNIPFDISFKTDNQTLNNYNNLSNTKKLEEILGFKGANIIGKTSYSGTTVDTIEDITKPRNIFICSNLINSVDSGAIIPVGGPLPVSNVLFSIPVTSTGTDIVNTQLESSISQEVYINSSLFSQKIKENKYDSDKVNLKFWIKLPGGIGYIKKPWYMRTLLSFKQVN
jgi:hypothetical protein